MSGEPWRVLALPPVPAELFQGVLQGLPVEVSVVAPRTTAAVRAALGDVDIVLGDWSRQLLLGEEELAVAPRLSLIQQPNVGVDGVDLAAAARRGIPVANTAGANADSVAEWCLAVTLSLLRRLGEADAAVRAGEWPQSRGLNIRELGGSRVGIIGMGSIGSGVARRLDALGAVVRYWSRRRRPDGESPAVWAELPDLLATSDVLVVVIALGEGTRGLIGRQQLAALPAGALLVDASRGGVVDHAALAAALRDGHLGGAAVDVYPQEPLPAEAPLRDAPRVLLSPHVAGASTTAATRMMAVVRENLHRALTGQPLLHLCNDTEPLVRRRPGG